jgi:uncharacterized membrane protein
MKFRLRPILITGVLTLTPVALSIYILYQLFVFFDQMLGSYLRDLLAKWLVPYIPGLGFLLLLLLVLATGLLTRLYLGRKLLDLGQWFLYRIPLLAKLAKAIRQILESFLTDNNELFRQAVLFEYPRKGIWAIGFLTRRTGGEVREKLRGPVDNEMLSIFVPTTPNPTSGVLVFVPSADVIFLEMSVEESLKLVVSGGALVQPYGPDAEDPAPPLRPDPGTSAVDPTLPPPAERT